MLPIVKGGHQLSQMEVCIKGSDVWKLFEKHQFSFTKNLWLDQVHSEEEGELIKEYQNLIQDIGCGNLAVNDDGLISLPEPLISDGFQEESQMQEAVIEYVYGNINEHVDDSDFFIKNTIICPHNDDVNKINEKIVESMDTNEWICYSSDTPCDENPEAPIEFLNTLNMPGFPLHELHLKKVCQ